MKKIRKSRWASGWFWSALIVLIAINWGASVWHTRIDLTNEHRFTLSNASKKVLKKIKEPVTVYVLLKGNFPSGFKRLSLATEDILNECKEIAGNKLQFHFVSPDEKFEGSEILFSDTLKALGMLPINLTSQVKQGQQQQYVYPVALVQYKERLLPVELYKGKTPLINFQELSSAEAMLEYAIVNTLAKIIQEEKPIVAYAIGNGEPMGYETYDLVENYLKPSYRFFTVDLLKQPFIPEEISALLLVKPQVGFTEAEKLKLDQYIMKGGKVLFFIDRLNAELDSLQIKNEVIAYDRDLNIGDQLFRYGVRINPNLVMDLQCDYLPFDVNGNGQFELLPWNYFPVFEPVASHPITKNLGFVSGRFVNSIDTIEAEGIQKTILLRASNNARVIASPALISGKENSTAPEDEKFKTPNIPVGVLLEGKFKSFFSNRLSQSILDSLNLQGTPFVSKCSNSNKMIIVSDGDILLNSVSKGNQPLSMGMNPFTYGSQREFPFANKAFLENCMEYVLNENGLSEAKSKEYVVRLLDTKKVNESKTFWQYINIILPVILMLIFAVVFQWVRKRKYTH